MTPVAWKGIYPAFLTPFQSDDAIHFEMFKTNLDAQLDAGIDGIILGGSLGEASTLTRDEKMSLLRFALETIDRPLPVIMNIAEQSTAEAIQFAQDAEKNGADGLMILPPMRYKADDRETVEYFRRIAETVS